MRRRFWGFACRLGGLAVFLLLFTCPQQGVLPLWAQDPAARDSTAWDARSLCILLLESYPEATDDASRAALRDAVATYDRGWLTIAQVYNQRASVGAEKAQAGLAQGDKLFRESTDQVAVVLARLPGLNVEGATAAIPGNISIPYGSAALLLKRRTGATSPRYLERQIDLSSQTPQRIDVQSSTDFYCLLKLINAPKESSRVYLTLMTGSSQFGKVDLAVNIPAKHPLQVQIADGDGHPTEASVGLYSSANRFLIPPTALDFSAAGYYYQPVHYRDSHQARYWPGGVDSPLSYPIRGGFTMDLPAGTYRLIAAKGPEYTPVDQQVTFTPGVMSPVRIVLRRWIDMAAQGWYSGDAHFHYARPTPQANQLIEVWAKAEDLKMANILRMGDGRQTYFEQYSFGKPGRFVSPTLALIPGQEDPRTAIMGHMIGLNLLRPVRNVERGYYVYRYIFEGIHRDGGLAGYAHITTYAKSSGAYRDLTINIAREDPDFVEICENGKVDTDIYYDFLNLGFKLTAMGGSDVPWGGAAGESRVYVHGGPMFDADRWFAEVKDGHTFVTGGPMLEFTVSGLLPGDEINAKRGEILKIHAKAMVGPGVAPPQRLEIIVNGDVVRSAEPSGHSATLDFDLPAEHSMWIAARTAGAHTTPIYVTVGGKRHWKVNAVPALLDRCSRSLDEVQAILDQNGTNIEPNRDGVWENADSFRAGEAELKREVNEARESYQRLRIEWQSETAR